MDSEPVSTIERNARTVREHYQNFWALHGRDAAVSSLRPEPPIMNIGYWGKGARAARDAQVEFVRLLASQIHDIDGSRVLDAGCGVGGPAIILAGEYGAQVDGINIIEEQVRLGRAYASAQGLEDRVRVHEANAMQLPFEDDSFDAVFSLEAAHCFADKPRFLAEVRRVLRPGGTLVMADITTGLDLPLVRWQPALKLDLVTAGRWREMLEAAAFRVTRHELVGRAIYPGFRRWLGETAGDRRQEIMNSLSRADAPAPVRTLRQVQAWLLEFALDRSVLPIAGVLRLRDYVLVVATKPE
jgi:ubiquinone/menaquinone biosynthesis C-methylase UbiE